MKTDNSNKRAGNMAEVQAGRNLRPSERKARHNKVYTAKGPRDRRVRLSADTAIQFYDVQDRLGYDRASEAVDWLIKKAKVSIDKLFGNSTSSSQNFDLVSNPSMQGNNINANFDHYHEDHTRFLEKEEFNMADDSMESSMLFPSYIHGGKYCSEESGSYNQQVGFEKGEIQRMMMFNCKLDDSTNEDHREQPVVMNNSTQFLMQPLSFNSNSTLPSVIQNSGVSSDEICKFYISGQGHGGQDQTMVLYRE